MVFSKKWLRNHPIVLLHFLIHIDVLMLCSKFEVIPTSIFQVMIFFKNGQKSEKIPVPWFFQKNGQKNHPQFLLHFLMHIDVHVYLCCVESLS